MEVREMRDAKPVELRRQAGERQFPDTQPHPARLEPGIAQRRAPRLRRSQRRTRWRASDFELLEDRLNRDDVPLELQLGLREARGDADELREMKDRHLEVTPGRLLQLRLPGVEREVAERARSDDRVGSCLIRLLDRLDQLGESCLLARLDDREAAALDLRGIVDRLAAAGLDDPLERPRPVGILEALDLRRAQDLAAVERCDLESLQPLVRGRPSAARIPRPRRSPRAGAARRRPFRTPARRPRRGSR